LKADLFQTAYRSAALGLIGLCPSLGAAAERGAADLKRCYKSRTMIRLALVALLVSAWAPSAEVAQPTFRAAIDLVTFGVTAVDKKGNLVTDLTQDDFQVVEDGKPQAIQYFTRGLGEGEGPATHVGLMLDTSASMENDLKMARSAAIKFLNMLPEAEDITLVDFDTEVRITRYPQRDFARLVERIRMRKPEGWTALYDALGVYLDGASTQEGRVVLVMYTDGADSRSRLRLDELMKLLQASQVTVYAVGLLDNTGRMRAELTMRLNQIVEATGGQAFFPFALKDLDAAYEKVLAEINAQYQLGYLSTNLAQDGHWRKVEIKVKRPDVKLRSRKGYFAPYKEHKEQ
jgi:Ca-activated chloride channel family protein